MIESKYIRREHRDDGGLAPEARADAAADETATDFVIFVGKHSDSVDEAGVNATRHSQELFIRLG